MAITSADWETWTINMKAGGSSILMAAEAVRPSVCRSRERSIVACVVAETGGGVGTLPPDQSGLHPDYYGITGQGPWA
ncbi:MAG: hypothetical protein R2856_08420 [Caldilineaceae bacterium]